MTELEIKSSRLRRGYILAKLSMCSPASELSELFPRLRTRSCYPQFPAVGLTTFYSPRMMTLMKALTLAMSSTAFCMPTAKRINDEAARGLGAVASAATHPECRDARDSAL
ncbi:unnamed protein product, partial [Trichogramma brassicae]